MGGGPAVICSGVTAGRMRRTAGSRHGQNGSRHYYCFHRGDFLFAEQFHCLIIEFINRKFDFLIRRWLSNPPTNQ